MITTPALESVLQINQNLNRAGKVLKPMDGTVLMDLAKANIGAGAYLQSSYSDKPLPVNSILNDSRTQHAGAFSHDEAMSDAVEIISETVRGNFELARNHILPLSKTIHDLYQQELDNIVIQSRQMVDIIPNIYHALWSTPHLYGMVERYENVPMKIYQCDIALPALTGAELMPMLNTDITSLDSVIQDWVKDLPADKLVNAYKTVFVERKFGIGQVVNAVHQIPDTTLDRNDVLIVYLICQGFEENMPDNLTMDLSVLRNCLAKMKEQAGRVVAREIKRREMDRQRHNLFYRFEEPTLKLGYRVFVNQDVYMDYLNAGGTVEALYGSVLTNQTVDYQVLLDQKDAYEKAYQQRLSLHEAKISANVFSAQRQALETAIMKYINTHKDELDKEQGEPADYHRRNLQAVGLVKKSDFAEDDMIPVVCCVCDVFYPHTNAKMIMSAMAEARQKDREITPRELALHAALDLLARWMASQIQVAYV